jgi:hypothetical protein
MRLPITLQDYVDHLFTAAERLDCTPLDLLRPASIMRHHEAGNLAPELARLSPEDAFALLARTVREEFQATLPTYDRD